MTGSYDSICCFRGSDHSATKRLLWEITTLCNLRCDFCHRTRYVDYGANLEMIQEIIPFVKAIGIKEIIISGGEPLLRHDIIDIIMLLKEEGFQVDMCTNGTNVTSRNASQLGNILSEISVSIDSATPLIHDLLRGSVGSWNATVSGIRRLRENGLGLHSISIVNKLTFDKIEDTVRFLYEEGVSSIGFIGAIPIGAGTNDLLSEECQRALRTTFGTLRERYPNIAINTKELIRDSSMSRCMAGRLIYGLDVNMVLSPCILQSRAGGIDLKRPENRTLDAIAGLKEISRNASINSTGQGFCPGSQLLNGT